MTLLMFLAPGETNEVAAAQLRTPVCIKRGPAKAEVPELAQTIAIL
jgi:hypothetical protein